MDQPKPQLNQPQPTAPKSSLSPLAAKFLTLSLAKRQALRRFRVLKDYLNYKFYSVPADVSDQDAFTQFSANYVREIARAGLEDDLKFIYDLGPEYLNQFKPNALKDALQDIEQAITSAKIVIVSLALELPDPEITKLGQFIKTNSGPQVLIEIQYDPALIGGCALSYNGVYRDFSIRRKIEENKKGILNTLLTYVK